jgi:predicted GNAT superfamily acetyltransferase
VGVVSADPVIDDPQLRDLTTMEEFELAGALIRRVWGTDADRSPLNVQQLPAMAHAGCQISGAFLDGGLVGATMAFLGREGDRTILHSHVTGVDPTHQGRGLGMALKAYQRRWCLDRGIDVVTWTFDPLVLANDRFNLVRLGARGVAYLRDFYGRMGDELNRDDPTDRLVARWELRAPATVDALGPSPPPPVASRDLIAAGAEPVVVDEGGEPAVRPTAADRRLIAVPGDVVALRRDDARRAARWRVAVRTALESALAAGHLIGPVTDDGLLVTAGSGSGPVDREGADRTGGGEP